MVRLITNSPVSSIIACEYLSGLTDIDTIAGSEHTVPAHATVIILGFSPSLWQLTITAGTGYNIFPGLKSVLDI